jgi:thymidylate kinase
MSQKIAFLGSHGSGKTSTINFIKNKLEKENKKVDVFTMGWKQFHNPTLRFFSSLYLKSPYKKNKTEDRLDRFKERSWLFYLIYYTELLTRYAEVKRSEADFILMDRYFYEELMFTHGLKRKLLRKFTPLPNETIVLETDSKTITSRGHKVSEEKLKNFYSKLRDLSNEFPMNFIDSSKKYENIFEEVINPLRNDN